jgi:peptide-methionine (R)-S-oxide reductase
MKKLYLVAGLFLLGLTMGYSQTTQKEKIMKVEKTEAEWREILSPEQFRILRLKGTDRPGNGGYTMHFEKGTYHCSGCGLQLFESGSKFDSHCGWPSFDQAIEGTVDYVLDKSHGMIRTEIICAACGGHLGHVFNDGPKETTGMRYCVNSTSIQFSPPEKSKKSK